MKQSSHFARSAHSIMAIALLCVAGCFVTEHPLPPDANAKVNPAYLGDWTFPSDAAGKPLLVTMRNIDGRNYYVEFVDKSRDEEPLRMTGYVVSVKGVDFAFVRKLDTSETLLSEFLVLRIGSAQGTLMMRHLADKFFESRKLDTPEKLRAVLETNVENEAMYDATTSRGTRVEKK